MSHEACNRKLKYIHEHLVLVESTPSNNTVLIEKLKIPLKLNYKEEDLAIAISDFEMKETIWKSFAEAARQSGAKLSLVTIPPLRFAHDEPPLNVGELIKNSTLVFMLTSKEFIHSKACHQAMKKGVRFVNMAQIDENLLLDSDETFESYLKMQHIGKILREVWTRGKEFTIETNLGTELKGDITGRVGYYVAGIAQKQPNIELVSCAFPDGEAGVAPIETSVNGKIVVDATLVGTDIGLVAQPVEIFVEHGEITEIKGGQEAERLRRWLEQWGDAYSSIVCEVSIGFNPSIRLLGRKSDKKALGTIHVGFGKNDDIGGQIESRTHLDAVIKDPTVYVDGRKIVEGRKLLI
jgi:leucyl aminopeptidase (aminopeptidase T)